MDVLKKLKIQLINLDLNNKDAAESIGLNQAYFSSIINGSIVPGRNAAVKIENFTNGEIKAHELMRL